MNYTLSDLQKLNKIDLTDSRLLSSYNEQLKVMLTEYQAEAETEHEMISSDTLHTKFTFNIKEKVLTSEFGELYDISTSEKLFDLMENSNLKLDWGLLEETLYAGYFCPNCGWYLGEERFDLCDRCREFYDKIKVID